MQKYGIIANHQPHICKLSVDLMAKKVVHSTSFCVLEIRYLNESFRFLCVCWNIFYELDKGFRAWISVISVLMLYY